MRKLRPFISGVLTMVIGSTVVFTTVAMINRYADHGFGEEASTTSKIDYQKKEKPPEQKQVVEQKPPPRRQPNGTPPAPLVGLDSSLGGLDLGIPGFNADDLGNLTGDLLGSASDVVMTDDSVDDPPRPMQQSPMTYPPRAKAKGIEGYVMLSLLISPTGEVERIKVLESQPSGLFEAVAIAGVKSWRFEPATYQGEAVRVWAKQRVRFDLS